MGMCDDYAGKPTYDLRRIEYVHRPHRKEGGIHPGVGVAACAVGAVLVLCTFGFGSAFLMGALGGAVLGYKAGRAI